MTSRRQIEHAFKTQSGEMFIVVAPDTGGERTRAGFIDHRFGFEIYFGTVEHLKLHGGNSTIYRDRSAKLSFAENGRSCGLLVPPPGRKTDGFWLVTGTEEKQPLTAIEMEDLSDAVFLALGADPNQQMVRPT
jgi:hypothetical protein